MAGNRPGRTRVPARRIEIVDGRAALSLASVRVRIARRTVRRGGVDRSSRDSGDLLPRRRREGGSAAHVRRGARARADAAAGAGAYEAPDAAFGPTGPGGASEDCDRG